MLHVNESIPKRRIYNRGCKLMSYTIPHFKKDEIRTYIDEQIKELKEYDIERFNQLVKDGELHNELFNVDYYVTYYYEAEEWLGSNTFEAMRCIKEYEHDNFGESYTDLTDSVKVVNMYVYILGEEILSEVLEN